MIKLVDQEDINQFFSECNNQLHLMSIEDYEFSSLFRKQPCQGYICVKEDNNVKGALMEYTDQNNVIVIDLLLVLPKYRRQGVGTQLISYLKEKQRMIIANPWKPESESLFIKSGFVVDEHYDPNDSNTVVYRV